MRYLRVLMVTVAIILAGAPLTLAQPDPQYLVMPGVGIGPIHLGMNLADVANVLGTPKPAKGVVTATLTATPGSRSFACSDTSFIVITTQEGVVYEIESPFDPKYSLGNGLRVGSKEADVRALMGEPSRIVPVSDNKRLVYDDKGVMFQIVTLTKSLSQNR